MTKIKEIENQYGMEHCLTLYCRNVEEQLTKDKKKYLIFHLTDGETDIDAKKWDYSMEDFQNAKYPCKIPGVICVKLECKEYKGQSTFCIIHYRGDDKTPAALFAKKAPIDAEEKYQKILESARTYREPFASIVTNLYEKNHNKLVHWGAAKFIHHNVAGGLLWHISRMHELAEELSKLYKVDRDLLLAGVDLHDIGKLVELETSELGVSEFTVEGSLLGHVMLGAKLVEDTVSELMFERTTDVLKLVHIILSHHGKQEWGAPVTPAFLEAQLLHFLDMMDSQGEQIERMTAEAPDGVSRPYAGSMKSNILFKG